MMETMPISEISITELVKKAGVGRVSFYRNYESKEDVIVKFLNELTKDWGKRFEEEAHPDFVQSIFRHFYDQRNLIQMLYRSNLSHLLMQSIRDICGPKPEQENAVAYWQAMISGALFFWCDEWVKRGMSETPEQMAALWKKQDR